VDLLNPISTNRAQKLFEGGTARPVEVPFFNKLSLLVTHLRGQRQIVQILIPATVDGYNVAPYNIAEYNLGGVIDRLLDSSVESGYNLGGGPPLFVVDHLNRDSFRVTFNKSTTGKVLHF